MTRPRAYELPRKRQFPRTPSVERLRKSAKKLLRRVREGDEDALARVAGTHPNWESEQQHGPLALHDTQWVLAREYGFESWTKMIRHVEEIRFVQENIESFTPEELVERLLERDWRSHVEVRGRLFNTMATGSMNAVIAGMNHRNPRIRKDCAQLMDHGADDGAIEALLEALTDPIPKVRAAALHSLHCQPCKPEPLSFDAIPVMIRVCREDPSPKVRWSAIGGLCRQPPDRRIVDLFEEVLCDPAFEKVHKNAVHGLRYQLRIVSLEELLERAEFGANRWIRQAAIVELAFREPNATAAEVLARLGERETNDILRRQTERARQHHADGSAALHAAP